MKKSHRVFCGSRKLILNIFCRGVYLAENTYQTASVEFVCCQQTNYARSSLEKLAEKPEGIFRQVQQRSRFLLR